jgi:hypothetical protein
MVAHGKTEREQIEVTPGYPGQRWLSWIALAILDGGLGKRHAFPDIIPLS